MTGVSIHEHGGNTPCSVGDCYSDPCAAADKLFGHIKGPGGKINLRAAKKAAKQQSGEALYIPHRRRMAAEGKDALINSPLIGPGINEISNATVGTGRRINIVIDSEELGYTPSQELALADQIKSRWIGDTTSKRKWIDQEGDQTLAEMQRTILEQSIAIGESYTLAFRFTGEQRPFPTALAIIDDDRVRTPSKQLPKEEAERVVAGHFHGDSGHTSMYYVHDWHRNDPRNFGSGNDDNFQRVRRYDDFGRQQVIHTYIKKLPGMSRGLSSLVSAFSKLKCFEQYEKARLESAIMQTAMAFIIKSNDKNVLSSIGGGMPISEDMLKKVHALSMKKMAEAQQYYNQNTLNIDGVKGIRLLPDEEAQLLTGSESTTNDKQFVDQCLTAVGRATGGLSRTIITQDFESSYSASRAVLLSFYRQCEMWAHYIIDDWLGSVYAIWLEDSILAGNIQLPGYEDDPAEGWAFFILNKDAFCRSDFRGPGRDEIDQAKAMTYWLNRKKIGAFNYAEFYDSKGKDWKEEIRQQIKELKFIDEQLELLGELKHIPNPLAYIMTDIATLGAATTSTEPEEEEEEEPTVTPTTLEEDRE